MKLVLAQQEINLEVTSLILQADHDNPNKLKMFFCSDCGRPVIQYSARLIMIVPGETPAILPIFTRCKTCKKQYLINSIL
jgi:uncharacterized protein with PIN domain